MTSSCDLDPIFVKALKLLQSRSKDSYFLLKQMYDDVVAQRRAVANIKRESDSDVKPFGIGNGSSVAVSDAAKKREHDTAEAEKLKQELAELSHEIPAKKVKLEPGNSVCVDRDRDRGLGDKGRASENVAREKPRERLREIEEDIFFGPTASSSSSSRVKERERQQEREGREKQTAARMKEKKETMLTTMTVDSGSDTEVSDDASGSGHDDTAAGQTATAAEFDLDIGNLSCVICNTMSISSTNRLVECQECHSLYHQDCHKPPVTEDVNDPRFVWYCSKCAKNLKKIVVKNQKKPSPKPPGTSGTSSSARDSPVSKPTTMKTDPPQLLQPFKRPEAIKPTVVTEAGRGLAGLASLAKNLNSRSSATSSSSSTTSSSDVSSKSKTDHQSTGNNRPPVTTKSSAAETKSSSSTGWSGSSAFSAMRPTTFGKTEPTPPASKSGKTQPVVTGPAKSSAAPASSIGVAAAVTSSTVKMSQSTLMSAGKRLQNMKKKAKLAEKRPR